MGKIKSIIAEDAEIVQQFKPSLAMEKWLDTAIELQSDSPMRAKHPLSSACMRMRG